MPEVFEKWGFGMSQPKVLTQSERSLAVTYLLEVLENARQPKASACELANLSIVKGLFNRVLREDQWDWFTVMGQLGYPSARLARRIAIEISDLRTAIRDGNVSSIQLFRTNLSYVPHIRP